MIGNYEDLGTRSQTVATSRPGIPEESFWAYYEGGINQVGCIYTAQGFEFDYVGVIFGTDLVYDANLATWKGDPAASADTVVRRSPEGFLKTSKTRIVCCSAAG